MYFKLFVLIATLSSVIAEGVQDGQHINIQRIPADILRHVDTFDEVPVKNNQDQDVPTGFDWAPCNITIDPFLSCHDCHTRFVCLGIAGRIKPCSSFKPFCNYGFCSASPSADCSTTSTTTNE